MEQNKVRMINYGNVIEIIIPSTITGEKKKEIVNIVNGLGNQFFYSINTDNKKSDFIDYIDVIDYLDTNSNRIFEAREKDLDLDVLREISGFNVMKGNSEENVELFAFSKKTKLDDGHKTLKGFNLKKGIYINLVEAMNALTSDFYSKDEILFTKESIETDYYTFMDAVMMKCRDDSSFLYGKEYKNRQIRGYNEMEKLYKNIPHSNFKGIELTKGMYVRKKTLEEILHDYKIKRNLDNKKISELKK